jgi:hypothetical protein
MAIKRLMRSGGYAERVRVRAAVPGKHASECAICFVLDTPVCQKCCGIASTAGPTRA